MSPPRKLANSIHPQVITFIIDDSGSMEGSKAAQVTEYVQDLVITLQSKNLGGGGFRFLLNLGKFGDDITPLAVAKSAPEISVSSLSFKAEGGQTNMSAALVWAKEALGTALGRCRAIPGYDENKAPNPLCLFFSDGENTPIEERGKQKNTEIEVKEAAQGLKLLPFEGGQVDVLTIGIGLQDKDVPMMRAIASDPGLTANISPERLGEFIAEILPSDFDKADLARKAKLMEQPRNLAS